LPTTRPQERFAAAGELSRGRSTWSGVSRLSRRLARQSSVGAIVTRRDFHDRSNTVGGFDASLRLGRVWSAEGQWVASRWTPGADQPVQTGTAYTFSLSRTGRTVTSLTRVGGTTSDFVSELGFIPRTDFHQATQSLTYTARPASMLNDWGPTLLLERIWAYDGTPLDWRARPSVSFNFKQATTFNAFVERSRITLDQPAGAPLALEPNTWGLSGSTSPKPAWSLAGGVALGRGVNFRPAAGRVPETGGHLETRVTLGLRPLTPLRIDNTWLRTHLTLTDGQAFLTNIVRTRWAWQFTREWSLRVIGQYDATRTSTALTAVAPRRNLNADVLLTRLLNPWTALYVGYNGNAQNIELLELGGQRTVRRTGTLAPDGWQAFVKWSHLLRW
jgi:hypothetical protein